MLVKWVPHPEFVLLSLIKCCLISVQHVNTFLGQNRNILVELGPCHGNWSSGYLCRRGISRHGTGYVKLGWLSMVGKYLMYKPFECCKRITHTHIFPFPNIRSALKISLAEAEWHIYVCKLTIFDSDNGLSPSHYLNNCWNIAKSTLGNRFQWNFNRNPNFFIKEMHLKMSSAKWRPFCHGLNVLTHVIECCVVRCVFICILDLHKLSLQYDPYISFTPYIVLLDTCYSICILRFNH